MNHKEMNAELARQAADLGLYCWINAGEIEQALLIRYALAAAGLTALGDAKYSGKGWVDAVVLGHRGTLFVENKTEDGRRTRAQERVARLLLDAGLAYRLYHPDDYDNGTVRTDLEGIA